MKKWLKRQVGIIGASYGMAMAYVAENYPVFAAGTADSSNIAKNIRKFLFPFYALAVGALCILSWLKGQTAVAAISLAVGIFFGIFMFFPGFIKTLLSTIAEWFGAGSAEGF